MKAYIITVFVTVALLVQPVFAGGKGEFAGWVGKMITAYLAKKAFKSEKKQHASSDANFNPKVVESMLADEFQKDLAQNKDEIFRKLYSGGKAKSIRVDKFETYWKSNDPKDLDDFTGFAALYTIFWEGANKKDGFTQLVTTYNATSDQYETEIVEASE